jgi:hypothetical protein
LPGKSHGFEAARSDETPKSLTLELTLWPALPRGATGNFYALKEFFEGARRNSFPAGPLRCCKKNISRLLKVVAANCRTFKYEA